ncbi:MAG: hypothetical protein Q7S92_06660 [Candidatus Diapherotrites archaeon]|nr:hypothetical protein [Candidatus Diapherotrites archaeon]
MGITKGRTRRNLGVKAAKRVLEISPRKTRSILRKFGSAGAVQYDKFLRGKVTTAVLREMIEHLPVPLLKGKQNAVRRGIVYKLANQIVDPTTPMERREQIAGELGRAIGNKDVAWDLARRAETVRRVMHVVSHSGSFNLETREGRTAFIKKVNEMLAQTRAQAPN